MSINKQTISLGDETISIETGNWAKQAHGSIVYRAGNLMLLVTVCAEKEAREGRDFFPLTVDYREKYYAVGRFPGGYIKRENRPGDHETLLSRMIDRPIRPLFPVGYVAEVQLLISVLSADKDTCMEGHAITAASAAIAVSDLPFHGPIAGIVVGKIDGEYILNPTPEQLEKSELELVVAGSADAVTMIEGGSREMTNEQILDAITFAHDNIKKMLDFQNKLASDAGVTKREVMLQLPDENLKNEVRQFALDKMQEASQNPDKMARVEAVESVCKETKEHFKEKLSTDADVNYEQAKREISEHLHGLEAEVIRNQIFDKKIRADGRRLDEIRDISVELDVLPGAHGSAVFTRGQTQSLGVVTLGTDRDVQKYENLRGQHSRRFMLHYNFPPYSVGEVKRLGGPGRREIGHGNLAERSLKYITPNESEFPYTVRVVSEIMESNGSSSMASVCSGSLSMMCAGVPIKNPVSGIAMGLITGEDGKYAVLSDIAGIEDHFGDMDFKVAGTKNGITALQLDIKVTGISIEVMREALKQAEEGRLHILNKMMEAIDAPRKEVAENAPRIITIQIDQERIGELIGTGGKVIRSISERSGADINVNDDGVVTISSVSGESSKMAITMVEDIFREIEIGAVYEGTVKKITDFGAFIEILPGKDGLCHISKIDVNRVTAVRDVVSEGEIVKVKVIGVDRQGRIDLSRKELLIEAGAVPSEDSGRNDRSGNSRGGNDRSRDDRGRNDRGRSDRSGSRHDEGGDSQRS